MPVSSMSPRARALTALFAAALIGALLQLAASTSADAATSPQFGQAVYSPAEIDAWSTTDPEYARLASSWAGNVNRSVTLDYGTEISSVERDVLKDESGYAKAEAVLFQADGNVARRTKVRAMLDGLRAVTSWQTDPVEQYRLVAGWSCTNLAQAAGLVDYVDPGFTRFLVEECYPLLDWPQNPNWHASFADSRTAIAAYVGDAALWADAKAYTLLRLRQSIYASAYDGSTIRPLLNADGSVRSTATLNHWGKQWGGSSAITQVTQSGSTFPFAQADWRVTGANAERTRDLGHVSMSNGAWMHALRTIRVVDGSIPAEMWDRLLAGYDHHAQRVLTYRSSGLSALNPRTSSTSVSGDTWQSWWGADELFGASTPASVDQVLDLDEVKTYPAAGANHLVAEPFADGTGPVTPTPTTTSSSTTSSTSSSSTTSSSTTTSTSTSTTSTSTPTTTTTTAPPVVEDISFSNVTADQTLGRRPTVQWSATVAGSGRSVELYYDGTSLMSPVTTSGGTGSAIVDLSTFDEDVSHTIELRLLSGSTTVASRSLAVRHQLAPRTWDLGNSVPPTSSTALSYLGAKGDVTLLCDWDGDGTSTPGVFRAGQWLLRNSAGSGPAEVTFGYGSASDTPLCGDWDGNGTDTVGVWRAGTFYLRSANSAGPTSTKASFGATTDRPYVGDWDGNGTDTIGVRAGATYRLRNTNKAGKADVTFNYGGTSDVVLFGDWDGNRTDTPAAFRAGSWLLRSTNTSGNATSTFGFGTAGDLPAVYDTPTGSRPALGR